MQTWKKGEAVVIEVVSPVAVTSETGKVLRVNKRGVWLDNGPGNDPSGPYDPKTGWHPADVGGCRQRILKQTSKPPRNFLVGAEKPAIRRVVKAPPPPKALRKNAAGEVEIFFPNHARAQLERESGWHHPIDFYRVAGTGRTAAFVPADTIDGKEDVFYPDRHESIFDLVERLS